MSKIAFWLMLAVGLPFIAAGVVKIFIAALLELIVGQHWKQVPDAAFDFVEGVVAMMIAAALAAWLASGVSILIPVVLIAWVSIALVLRREPSSAPAQIAGVVLTYVLLVY